MYGSRLGPSFKLDEIKAYLDKHDISNKLYKDKKTLSNKIAKLISKGQIVGLFQGRVEFGPRALGSRSILGDARDHKTQSKMNLKIKYRESFRPFAPAIMYDKVSDYFDLNIESPYMLLVTKVNEDIIYKTENNSDDIYEIVNQKRSSIPAVTHVDYSARVQTVHPDNDSFFYSILNSFYELTGCPVIVNTSFNVRGEPIVCTPEDAFNCFMSTEMDILVLENYLIEKKNLSDHLTNADWGREYELD